MITVPGLSFQYNLPENQHGIPSEAKELRQKKMAEEKKYEVGSKRKATTNDGDVTSGGKQRKKSNKTESDLVHEWEKAAAGQFAEQKVHDMLQKRFSNKPCLLVHGFKESDLVKVIRENIEQERRDAKLKQNKTVSKNNLTEKEFQFFKLTNRHFCDLENQVTNMMETFAEDRFCEDNMPLFLNKIEEDKPGYDILTESHKKNYMKTIGDFLKKKFRDGVHHTRNQMKDMILEHFLKLTYPNSEYDLLLFLKVYAIYKSVRHAKTIF